MVGPPPADVLELGHWFDSLAASSANQVRRGRGSREVREEIRASCRAFRTLVPAALAADAEGLIDAASVDETGPPPAEPLARVVWLAKVIADELWRSLNGEGGAAGKELRATASALVVPPDAIAAARKAILDKGKLIKQVDRYRDPDILDPLAAPLWWGCG